MFTLKEIQAAHAKLRSGADYPAFVQEIIKMGVGGYETYVKDGNTVYSGADQYQAETGPKYQDLFINDPSDRDAFQKDLKSHQEGRTDFPRFCADAARAGVEKWKVDTRKMTCSYLDKNGQVLVTETIPGT